MTLPQPEHNNPGQLPDEVPHMPTEIAILVMEGFKLVYSTVDAMVNELRAISFGYHSERQDTNTALEQLKEFVEN